MIYNIYYSLSLTLLVLASLTYYSFSQTFIMPNKQCDSYILHNASQYCTLSNSGFSDAYIRKYFFASLKEAYNSVLDKNSIIIDVGSNKGDVTQLFNTMFSLNTVVSIEPLIINYQYQVYMLGNISNIKIYNYGISNKNYIAKIYSGKNVGYMYVKGEKNMSNKIAQNVKFITLDYFLQNICMNIIDCYYLYYN